MKMVKIQQRFKKFLKKIKIKISKDFFKNVKYYKITTAAATTINKYNLCNK